MAKNALSEYSAKRTFTATPEPPPSVPAPGAGPLLFVVQQHSATRLHFDFRLECGGVLLSWAVPKGPSLDRNEKRLAVQTEDHPYDYGSFEGVIPAGQYGAGEVIVWDCGVYSPDEDGATWFHDRERAEAEVRKGLAAGKLSVFLRGEKLKGSFALVRTKDAKQWLMIKHNDRFAASVDVTARDRSVLSGKRVTEIKFLPVTRMPADRLAPTGKISPMPSALSPMLAESADAAFNKPDWLWEPKLDGYRILAFIDEHGIKLRSRRNLELASKFPKLLADLAKQAVKGMILDGELVAFDTSGKPSFGALQDRAQLKTDREIAAADLGLPVVFYCFDLLYFAGVDLRNAVYEDRRRYLAQCLLPSPLVQLVHVAEDGVALNAAAIESGFEGVVGKRKNSRYEAGRRSPSWLKVKPTQSSDFVVGGFTSGKGARASLGAVLVGYFDDEGGLRYASHVGSGFDDRSVAAVQKRLTALKRNECPFTETPELNGSTTWVEPRTVAEVSFHSWTDDERLRAPVFLRLRDDVDPRSVRRPVAAPGNDPIDDVVAQLRTGRNAFTLAVGAHRIKLTNLDRVYWPADPARKLQALTKRDLLVYFAQVSPYILTHLADRPLTMIRMPEGIRGQRFFQKHWGQERPPFAETITVFSSTKEESHDYLLCNNVPTLLWLAQSGTLEFHVWHSRAKVARDASSNSTDYASSLEALEASVLNYPDYVVFDLDPYIYSGQEAKGAEPELNTAAFEKGKEVAFWLRELLNGMSLEPIVKTSGKTGLHIFVPIRRTIDFDAARHVCELVGAHLVRLHPKDVTQEWSVPKRTGKIFMDFNMNVRGKTLNVAYSPRGERGAPVSMPLTWEELAGAHPLDFTITNAPGRLARTGERWKDALEQKQSLENALARARP
jgi:bifunctional non-homologous end joining protein LigD